MEVCSASVTSTKTSKIDAWRKFSSSTLLSSASVIDPRCALSLFRNFLNGKYTETHRESVSDASLSSVLDRNFLHASIFDVFALVGSVQRIGDRCAGH